MLFAQGTRLRQLVDERYTASSLLNLSNVNSTCSNSNTNGENTVHNEGTQILPSSQICNNSYLQILRENSWLRDGASSNIPIFPTTPEKRVRRSGKYTPQERDRIR